MSIEVLRDELAALPQTERSKIMAFLVALQDRDDRAYRERLARMIDDRTPERWMRVEEADQRLGIDRGETS